MAGPRVAGARPLLLEPAVRDGGGVGVQRADGPRHVLHHHPAPHQDSRPGASTQVSPPHFIDLLIILFSKDEDIR